MGLVGALDGMDEMDVVDWVARGWVVARCALVDVANVPRLGSPAALRLASLADVRCGASVPEDGAGSLAMAMY